MRVIGRIFTASGALFHGVMNAPGALHPGGSRRRRY